MLIVTWNILHIIHEIKFVGRESIPITAFDIYDNRSNERNRMASIVNTVKEYINGHDGPVVICLQEVPGDYVVEFNKIENIKLYSYKYSRLPSLKSGLGSSPYSDISEHLVTIVKGCNDTTPLPVVQFTDPGKACLPVKVNDFTVCNVHMPFGNTELNTAIMRLKTSLITSTDNKYIVCGDFNTSPDRLNMTLYGSNGTVVQNNVVTHKTIKNGTITPKIYDHFVFYNLPTTGTVVHVNEVNTSDHFPISITV